MKNKLLLLFTFGIITFLCLYKLGQQPLSQWDEARRAINAMEMIRTGDLVNLYYRGLPEVSNFKPPFVVWCEASWATRKSWNN
jgi:4-amino-4-deoxy-L-arabinose transferase-like glycosyltransferase